MKTTLELWSQLVFRISGFTLAGLLVVFALREQNRPEEVDLRDARYLEKMETYITLEKAGKMSSKPQFADDQRGFRATPLGVRSNRPHGGCIRS